MPAAASDQDFAASIRIHCLFASDVVGAGSPGLLDTGLSYAGIALRGVRN